jgi:hypothetical protein
MHLLRGIFIELAEAEEFDVYVKYAQTVTLQQSRQALQAIVDNPEVRFLKFCLCFMMIYLLWK